MRKRRIFAILLTGVLTLSCSFPGAAEQLPAGGDELSVGGEQLPAGGDELSVGGEQLPAGGDELSTFLEAAFPETDLTEGASEEEKTEDEKIEEEKTEDEKIEEEKIEEASADVRTGEETTEEASADAKTEEEAKAEASADAKTEEEALELTSSEEELSCEPEKTGGGQCGDNVTWNLSGSVLTISGEGEMWEFSDGDIHGPAPWNKSAVTSVVVEAGVTSIGRYSFMECVNLVSVSLSSGLQKIEEGAFAACTSLKSLKIPDSVTSISEAAFSGCEAMSSLDLGKGILSLGDYSFAGCGALKTLHLPASVTFIRSGAFSGCTGVGKIYFYGDAPQFGEDCFEEIEAAVYYPSNKSGWTEKVMRNYGGNLNWGSWVALNPAVITGLFNSSQGGDLRWQAEADAEKYEIYRTNGGKTVKIATVDGTVTSYMDTEIKDNCWGKVYVYYVRCRAGENLSLRGEGMTLQRLAPMTINYCKNDKNSSAVVKWIVSTGSNKANGYELQYAESKEDLFGRKGTFKKAGLDNRKSLSKTISGLTKGKTYYFRVRAYVNYTHSVTGVTTKTWSQYSNVKSVKINK